MAWPWAAQRVASVSPWRPAWHNHMCDWVRLTPGASSCWTKNFPCMDLASRAWWWLLSTAMGSVCLGHEAKS
eukprot:8868177-Ditylum_brightwellii.AAC.1